MARQVVLASTSRYRSALLDRLGIVYSSAAPNVDESPLAGENPRDLAIRLSIAKARAVGKAFPDALVIGSDQVAEMEGRPIGKPGSKSAAIAQLRAMSGKTLVFHSGVALLNARNDTVQALSVPTLVEFRVLEPAWIVAYTSREPAYDCAGSAKVEGLGISLMQRVQSDDPTALIGLPLIALTQMLADQGLHVLGARS